METLLIVGGVVAVFAFFGALCFMADQATERSAHQKTKALAQSLASDTPLINESKSLTCKEAQEHLKKAKDCYAKAVAYLESHKFSEADKSARTGLTLLELARALCSVPDGQSFSPPPVTPM